MNVIEIPLFPLHSVLFPGGPLALRVFEPRYLHMVGRAIQEGSAFGVCLISEGDEVGEVPFTFDVGTLVRVSYWHRRPDDMLGITVIGEQRFRILERMVQPDHLVTARVMLLANESAMPLPAQHQALATLLEEIVEQLGHPFIKLPKHYDDAVWVGARLTELLPLALEQKQLLLQLENPLERLERLAGMIETGELA